MNDFGNSWAYGECTTPCDSTTCTVDPCEEDPVAKRTALILCESLDVENQFSK